MNREDGESSEVLTDESRTPLSRRTPRIDPQEARNNNFWKSPFCDDSSRTESHPTVVHIIENTSDVISSLHNLRGNLYIPLTKSSIFHSHWLQDLLDQDLKFYLHPMDEENLDAKSYYEGVVLLKKVKFIVAKFEWDPQDPIHICLKIAENHGNYVFRKRKFIRPLYSHTVYVDHDTSSILFQGPEFRLTIGQPFLMDANSSLEDPGCHVDVGVYSRELDTNPLVNIKWLISLQKKWVPDSVLQQADTNNAETV